ncbi:MAG: Rho termination factor N-terminal domain-containing protein, partial [Acidimicrobiia bacterium]
MSSTTSAEQFAAERAMLGSRDREQLHEIASAMGVRGATRLRKADLVEAILAAATGGNGIPEPSGDRPKKKTTRRKAEPENGDSPEAREARAGEAAADREAEAKPAQTRAAEARDARSESSSSAPETRDAEAPPAVERQRFSFGPDDRSRDEAVSEAAPVTDTAPATGSAPATEARAGGDTEGSSPGGAPA